MTFDPTKLAAETAPDMKRGKKGKGPAADSSEPANGKATEPHVFDPPISVEAPNRSVVVEVPIQACYPGFASPRFEFRATPRQAAAAKVLWSSLSERGERFQGGSSLHPNGKTVENHHDGLRWLLDRLADAIEAETKTDLLTDYSLAFR